MNITYKKISDTEIEITTLTPKVEVRSIERLNQEAEMLSRQIEVENTRHQETLDRLYKQQETLVSSLKESGKLGIIDPSIALSNEDTKKQEN